MFGKLTLAVGALVVSAALVGPTPRATTARWLDGVHCGQIVIQTNTERAVASLYWKLWMIGSHDAIAQFLRDRWASHNGTYEALRAHRCARCAEH